MGLSYKVTKKSFGFDKEKTEKYVASAVRSGTVSFNKLVEQISLRSGLPKATCKVVVETMAESACTWLLEGHGVSLGNLGYLKPAITCKSSEIEGKEKIVRKRVLFLPSKDFKEQMDRMTLDRISASSQGPEEPEDPDAGEEEGGGGELSADHNDTIQGVGEYPKWYFPTLFLPFSQKCLLINFSVA